MNADRIATPRVVLAAMEGLADDILRGVLTGIGGYHWCVTEFIRVSTTLLSPRHFFAYCPELANAARAVSLGA